MSFGRLAAAAVSGRAGCKRRAALGTSPEAAKEWMQDCIASDPADLELGRSFARRLAQAGLRDDALREWNRVLYYHPGTEKPCPRSLDCADFTLI